MLNTLTRLYIKKGRGKKKGVTSACMKVETGLLNKY